MADDKDILLLLLHFYRTFQLIYDVTMIGTSPWRLKSTAIMYPSVVKDFCMLMSCMGMTLYFLCLVLGEALCLKC